MFISSSNRFNRKIVGSGNCFILKVWSGSCLANELNLMRVASRGQVGAPLRSDEPLLFSIQREPGSETRREGKKNKEQICSFCRKHIKCKDGGTPLKVIFEFFVLWKCPSAEKISTETAQSSFHRSGKLKLNRYVFNLMFVFCKVVRFLVHLV